MFRRRFDVHPKHVTPIRRDKDGKVITRTKQSFKEECDINNIVRRSEKTGILPQATRQAIYGEFDDAGTYYDAMLVVVRAREQFENLPARVRARFANSPENFLEFVENPANAEELIKLGLATERPKGENKGGEGTNGVPAKSSKKLSTKPKATPPPDKGGEG